MDIRIGTAAPTVATGQADKQISRTGSGVEARLLAIRMPRRKPGGPPAKVDERRGAKRAPDPPSGRVLVLMVPDAGTLPRNIESGEYRVFLRFVRR